MKILTIYFKNLNSVEGESRIDFQTPPLSNTGVFAIIGPNGSGKSTILDAISLAFYGETFRFDRPAEHVMTQNSSESFAQVDFRLNNKNYRTRWQVKRQNGALQDPDMKLLELNADSEVLVEQGTQAVASKISEIVGMDFHNFSRSIMLAQGDFAAFLNALDSERMDILERMSSADIYAEHKQLLQDKKDQAETAVADIKQEIELLPVMDEATEEAAVDDLNHFKEQLSDYKLEQHDIREHLAWVKKVNNLEQQIVAKNKQQQQLEKQQQQGEQQLVEIEQVSDALVFEDDVAAVEDQQKQFLQSQKNTRQTQRELNTLQTQLKESSLNNPNHSAAETEASTENGNSESVENADGDANTTSPENNVSASEQKQTVDDLKYHTSQLKLSLEAEKKLQFDIKIQLESKQKLYQETQQWLDENSGGKCLLTGLPETAKLRDLRAELVEKEKEYQVFVKQSEINAQVLAKNSAGIEHSIKQVADLEKQVQHSEQAWQDLNAERDLESLKSLVEEQKERVSAFKQMLTLAKENQKANKGGFLSLFRSPPTDEERPSEHQLQQQGDKLAQEIEQEKMLIVTLEKAVHQETLIKKLLQHRSDLEQDTPCPLCGALVHPFIDMPPADVNSKPVLIAQKNKLQALVNEAEKLKQLQISVQKQTQREEGKQQLLQKNRSQWKALATRLNVARPDFDMDSFDTMKQRLKDEEQELKNLHNLLGQYEKQQQQLNALKQEFENEKLQTEQLKAKKQTLDMDAGNLPAELEQAEVAFKQCQEKEQAVAAQVNEKLESLGETMPTKIKEAALMKRLETRKQEFSLYQSRYDKLTEEIAPLQQQQQQVDAKVESLTAEAQQQSAQLGQQESIGLHLTILEKQKVLSEQQDYQTQQQQKLEQLQQALEQKLASTPYSDIKLLKQALQKQAQKGSTEKQLEKLIQQQQQLEQQLEKNHAQLDAEKAQAMTQATEAELNAQQRAINEKIAIVNDEIRHLEDKQRKQLKFKERHDVLRAKLEEQQQQLQQSSENLNESEENGIVFRRRVQLHLATQLLTQTNKVLEKISGRYYLRQAPSEQGFALEIEDTLQNNSRRLPKSLSGGESFVVSLALALGLAEMANDGKTVDSLFLDEGFGNLDAEALVMVVSTLQQLQTHGKTVGVISHVDGVRKRIKTRIEMVKKPNGLSQLKKVS